MPLTEPTTGELEHFCLYCPGDRRTCGHVTAEVLEEARGWIADCVWADLESDDVPELTDAAVIAGIARHYSGGMAEFVADLG